MLRINRGRGFWAAVFLLTSGGYSGCADPPAAGGMPFRVAQADDRLPYPFLEQLELSAEQRKAIREIMARYRPARDPEARKQWREDFKDTLSEPNLDEARLRELVTQLEQKRRDALTNLVPLFMAIRGVLTQDQLDSAVARIAEMRRSPTDSAPSPDAQATEATAPAAEPSVRPIGPDIRLTDEQRELWRQMRPPRLDRDAVLAAVSTLLQSGDSAPLSQALGLHNPIETRVDQVVDALPSLTTEQRRALIDYQPSAEPREEEASPGEDVEASPRAER